MNDLRSGSTVSQGSIRARGILNTSSNMISPGGSLFAARHLLSTEDAFARCIWRCSACESMLAKVHTISRSLHEFLIDDVAGQHWGQGHPPLCPQQDQPWQQHSCGQALAAVAMLIWHCSASDEIPAKICMIREVYSNWLTLVQGSTGARGIPNAFSSRIGPGSSLFAAGHGNGRCSRAATSHGSSHNSPRSRHESGLDCPALCGVGWR